MPSTTIGVDAHVLTGKFQGTRTTLTSLLRALGGRIGERKLIVYSDDPRTARTMVGVEAFDYRALSHGGSLKRLLIVLPRLFRGDGVDIGVFQYIAPLSGKHIIFVHDILPISHPRFFPLRNRLRTWLLYSVSIRHAAMVLAVSEDSRRHVERVYRLPATRLRTVLNGPSFPPAAYAGDPMPGADRYILAVGRIERRKNIPMLIEAVLKADVPGVRLIVVGAFDLDFRYQIPDDPRIDVRKNLPEADLIALYRGASLFVYPSSAEGFGMPLLDATLFGLPIISSNLTAMPEVAGDLATYFNPDAADALDVLATLIQGHFGAKPIRRPTPEECRAQAERFSWDRAAIAFLDALASIEAGVS